ncbi:MAG: hypothetical protein CVU50_03790 [Candidatus Cloacimonetes bacterium HGW-Cloacimonetes-3]|jgi:hypothetical protein|nr:MAG: hypothetical protein CVU50_03790 [Candidatus Cloacimonetes bacterium HGW-Cloacimonetes-3]
MKVSFENGVSTYSGKYKEVVYQTWFRGRLCYARKYAYPVLGVTHQEMREIALNLNTLYLDADSRYVSDLKAYAEKNKRENLPKVTLELHKMPSSKALFIHCMWDWYKSDPTHVDLKTVTLSDIVTLDSPVQTVAKCVNAGYLKRVTGYADYTHPIVDTP